MKTLEQQIEIMQACLKGIPVKTCKKQKRSDIGKQIYWVPVPDKFNQWNWQNCDYELGN